MALPAMPAKAPGRGPPGLRMQQAAWQGDIWTSVPCDSSIRPSPTQTPEGVPRLDAGSLESLPDSLSKPGVAVLDGQPGTQGRLAIVSPRTPHRPRVLLGEHPSSSPAHLRGRPPHAGAAARHINDISSNREAAAAGGRPHPYTIARALQPQEHQATGDRRGTHRPRIGGCERNLLPE